MSDTASQAAEAFAKLKERFTTSDSLYATFSAIARDARTYMAPGTRAEKGRQYTTFHEAAQILTTAPEVGEWLDTAEQDAASLSEQDREELHQRRQEWISAKGIQETIRYVKEEVAGADSAYTKLKERFATIYKLGAASNVLQYDNVVFNWPTQDDVVEYSTATATAGHELLVAAEVGEWLDEAEKNAASLPEGDRRNLALMRRQWIHETALSAELVAAQAQLYIEGENLHTKNRKSGDWSTMRDWYAHSFEILRAVGAAKQAKLGTPTIYDALLDSFSPGISDAALDREFGKLEKALPVLIRQALEKQKSEPAPIPLSGTFTRAQQEELFARVGKAMQFDLDHGRYDVFDGHPFTSGTPLDARFTTDCDEANFLKGLYSFIHECGHAKYEQGQPKDWLNQPAGNDLGMGVHETQSRIMELYACRTPEFLGWLETQVREVFGRPDDPALSAENLGRLLNGVKPSFIRVEADGMTYPAHILLRRKLEKELVNGTLPIDDLPTAWADGIEKLLGVRPASPAEGCMQDVHWPVGLVGYFPAYTLGDAGAAQFFAAACRERPELIAELGNGNFAPLNEWLDENVRGKGCLLPTDQMFAAATGEPLNFDYYLERQAQFYLGKPLKDVLAADAAARPAAPGIVPPQP